MYTGTALRKLREGAGLSRSQLAYRLGVSVFTVKAWELDRRQPRNIAQKALEKLGRAVEQGGEKHA